MDVVFIRRFITNGVSFSLAAGACCVIKFSNIGTAQSGASISSININSTGVKSVTAFSTGHFLSYGNRTRSGTILHKYSFVVYDGSTYGIAYANYYADYGDEG